MLSLTIVAMAVAVTSALPRGELGMEEGNLYPGLYRDQTMNEKDGRNLDSLDSLQNNKNWSIAKLKRNLSEMQKSQWSKRGGGNLLRDLEAVLRTHPNLFYGRSARNHDTLDSLSGITFGSQKRFDSLSPAADKRNFDEIDRTGFNSFIKKKKNFDEIDRSGFDGFVKRNFDEIDRVGFGSFIKKSGDPRH